MTKRQARKIAILRAAQLLRQDECWGTSTEVQKQTHLLGRALAKRYGIAVGDIPMNAQDIEEAVLNGNL